MPCMAIRIRTIYRDTRDMMPRSTSPFIDFALRDDYDEWLQEVRRVMALRHGLSRLSATSRR